MSAHIWIILFTSACLRCLNGFRFILLRYDFCGFEHIHNDKAEHGPYNRWRQNQLHLSPVRGLCADVRNSGMGVDIKLMLLHLADHCEAKEENRQEKTALNGTHVKSFRWNW